MPGRRRGHGLVWHDMGCGMLFSKWGGGRGANLEQVLPRELLPFDRAFWGGRRFREEMEAKGSSCLTGLAIR